MVSFFLSYFCILIIQLTKQKNYSGELYKDGHLPISAFYNVLKCSMFGVCMFAFLSLTYCSPVVVEDMIFVCVPNSPLPPLYTSDVFLKEMEQKSAVDYPCLALNWSPSAHLVVQGGKEGNRNAWSQFWNIFRSEQFILKEEQSIGIPKKAIKPVNNLHSGHSGVKNSRKDSLEKAQGREYV